jgi:hypothetical protein
MVQKRLAKNFRKDGSFSIKLLLPRQAYHFMEISGTGCRAWMEYIDNQPHFVLSYPAATDQRTIRKLV